MASACSAGNSSNSGTQISTLRHSMSGMLMLRGQSGTRRSQAGPSADASVNINAAPEVRMPSSSGEAPNRVTSTGTYWVTRTMNGEARKTSTALRYSLRRACL